MIMSRAPSTPKAGSSLVLSEMGAGVGDAVAVAVAVIVALCVIVALTKVGRIVVTDVLLRPERLRDVTVTELVVCTTVVAKEIETDGVAEFPEDCAEVEMTK